MSPKKIFEKKIAILFHNFPFDKKIIKAIIIDQKVKIAKLEADNILKTGAITKNKWNGLAPTQKSIGITGLIITKAVPRSGWLRTIIAGINAMKNGMRLAVKWFNSMFLSDKYLARVKTTINFAISDGCRLKGKPIFIHLWVSATLEPKKGMKTATIINA